LTRRRRIEKPEHRQLGLAAFRELKGKDGEKRLRVGDFGVRFTEEHPETLRIHAVKNRKDAYR
jgi:hypothetical protein